MKRNTLGYKVRQYLMFGGVGTLLFCAVVVVPFIYGIYLTFTSWDGTSLEKPFVGFANYQAAFADSEFWLAKIKRNMERDNEVNKALYGLGWKVLRFWSKDVLSDINTCINIIDDCVDSNKD